MDMTLRWYGPGYDSVTLKQIRQIPGVKNVITTLFGKQAGERWLPEEIAELKRIVEDAGLGIAGIESVNVSDDIKIGTAKADEHIDNYIKTLKISEKRTYIWYVTILCLYLTGHDQNLQEKELMVQRCLHIIRIQLI